MNKDYLAQLKTAIETSSYTVALCGSGCLKECGSDGLKSQPKAYEIESKYGISPEYLYTSAYFSSRPKQFFEFYRNELLTPELEPGATSEALARMEKNGLLQCVITSNIFNLASRGGCQHVINLHGSIYHNYCTHCGHDHSIEYIKNCSGIPLCEKCGHSIRPGVFFYGDMIDNAILTEATKEVKKADLLLLLGTTLRSEVFHGFLEHFDGSMLAMIHEEDDLADKHADLVIYAQPKDVLKALGYTE